MNSTRATLAIARRHMSATWIISIATRIAFAVVYAFIVTPATNPWVFYILAILYAAFAGAELRVRDLMYFAAPLYGRQLARAHALTALVGALAPPAAFFAVQALRGMPWTWLAMLATGAACAVAALVGLSVSLRRPPADGYGTVAATSYLAIALAGGATVAALFSLGVPAYGWLAVALLLGFLALRAFGETLARYDPVD